MTNSSNSDNPLDAAKPELADGPLGLPYVKPQGAPDLPGDDVDVPNPLGGN